MLLIGLLLVKWLRKIYNAVFSNESIVFGNTDSDIVILFSNDIDFNTIKLLNINLDHYNFEDYDPKTINQ